MKSFALTSIVVVLIIAAACSSTFMLNATVIALIAYSLIGPGETIRAAALSVVLKYLNPALALTDSTTNILFWVLLLAIGLRNLPLLRRDHLKILAPIWIFALLAAFLSWLSSNALMISMMKVATFAWVVPGLLTACLSLDSAQVRRLRKWLTAFMLTNISLSLVTLFNSSIAFKKVPGSLQGILNHPQSFGTFSAPAAAWVLTGLIAVRGKWRIPELAAAAMIVSAMFMSLSRTAALATIIGLLASLVRPLFSRVLTREQAGVARIAGVLLIFSVIIGSISLVTDDISNSVSSFIKKRGNEDLSQAFYDTRGRGIAWQWHNFLDRPFLGNGFGVFADGSFPAGVVEWNGIPISAPIEKGFIPTAVLEETGIFGAIAFILIIISCARHVYRNNMDPRWVAAFWTAVTVNLGEAVILAPGGIGLYIWIVIGICISSEGTFSDSTTSEMELFKIEALGHQPKNLMG